MFDHWIVPQKVANPSISIPIRKRRGAIEFLIKSSLVLNVEFGTRSTLLRFGATWLLDAGGWMRIYCAPMR